MISLCQLSLSLLNKNNIMCHGAPSWAEGIQTEGTVADLFWAKKSYFSVYLLQFNQSKSEVLSVQQVWIQVQVCAELLLTAALMKCLSTEGAAAAVNLTRPRLQYLILNSIQLPRTYCLKSEASKIVCFIIDTTVISSPAGRKLGF